jgi:TP901 family phage tail tape measure protein
MKREVVIELQLQDKNAVQRLGQLNVESQKVNDSIKLLNSIIAENGKATVRQQAQLGELIARKKNLSAQSRELSNDISGLTASGMRFRDKMAQASLEALKQSGILGQLDARSTTLTAQIDALGKEYAEGKVTAEQFAQQNNRLQKELSETTAAMTKMDAKLEELNKDFKEGRITAEQFKAGVNSVNQQVAQASGAFTKGVTDIKNYALGFVGTIAILQGAIAFFGNLARTVADFDKALSGIRALGGEYAANIDAIGEAAKTAGINFGFSATESLGAVEALAKAGVSTADILGGGLTGALTLAAAGQLDVATAAETASKAMTQFGLAGEDIPHLADLLAAGAASATGEVTDFAQALNQGGLVASQMGISIEETIGTLTAFASAGLIGSDAGTSFRTMLQRLAKPSKEAADRMKELGINAFDAQGNFVGLEKFAGELREGFADLTEEQRANATVTIFGSDAQRAANVLYTQGAEGIAKYTAEVNKAGFAEGVAGEQTNNLRGSLARARETWNGFVLSIENGSGTIGKAIQVAVDSFTQLINSVQDTNFASDELERVTGRTYWKNGLIEPGDYKELANLAVTLRELDKSLQKSNTVEGYTSAIFTLQQQIKKTYEDLKNGEGTLDADAAEDAVKLRVEAIKRLTEARADLRTKLMQQTKTEGAAKEVTDEGTEGAEKNTTAVKTQAAAVRVLTDRLREFQQLQEQLESGQGIGPMAVRSSTTGEQPEKKPLGPSPAVQAAVVEGQALAQAYSDDVDAYTEAQLAKIAVADEFADALGGLTQLLGEQTAAGKTFATAQALINTYLGVTQILANKTTLPEPAATIQKTLAVAGTLASGLAAVRRIQGFAEGGVVQQADGPRYTANRGDSVLISAAPGEVVLTRDQQLRLRALAGHRIFNDIGVPGFASGGLVRGTALANMPRTPSSGAVANAELSRAINSIDMSPVVRVTEIMDVMRSVQVAQSAASL